MKISKTSSLLRLVAFLLITVVLIGVVGVVSEGMSKEPDNNQTDTKDNSTQTPPATDIPVVSLRYENYLSGLSCTIEESQMIPLCYLMTPSTSLYGIKNAELTIEFPLESGKSRMLVYTTRTNELGKIGAIAPLRRYMLPLLHSFGGICVHNGEDDTIHYTNASINDSIDLSKSNAHSYTEGQGQIYTNGALVANAMESLQFVTKENLHPTLPYAFQAGEDDIIYGKIHAQNITIPFGSQNQTQLIYDIATKEYRYESNGEVRCDLHTGEIVTYKNAFLLFCDSMTYERAETTELVFETTSGGTGYYFTNGTMIKFIWSSDENGQLLFRDLAGEKLIINRGNSYISFYKTTLKNSIIIY